MASDAMDWHPTTPPVPHDPYSIPRYIPGGWPNSPYPNEHTTGVFARKRPSTLIERAAKRVCIGITKLATLPIQPIFLIVRRIRSRRHNEARRPRRDPAQHLRNPPALRARIAAAEQLLNARQAASLPQQDIIPPSTPKPQRDNISVNSIIGESQTPIQSPAATSVTNTETPASVTRVVDNVSYETVRTGEKRSRIIEEGESDLKINQYSSLEDYLTATTQQQQPTPEPEDSSPTKRMKGLNRFDVSYKRVSTAHAGRKKTSDLRVRPIGTRAQNSDNLNKLFGGWEHEKPLGLTPPSPDPSEQMQPAADPHSLDSPASSEPPQQHGLLKNANQKSKDEAAPPECHDERWSIDLPLDIAFAEHHDSEDVVAESTQTNSHKTVTATTDDFAMKSKLFNSNKARGVPLIKPRLVPSAEFVRKQQQRITEPQSVSSEITEDATLYKHGNANVAMKDGNCAGDQEPKTCDTIKNEAKEDVKPNIDGTQLDDKPATVSATSLRATAQKLAEQEPKTPISKVTKVKPETPADQLSKLDINDSEENDTPKASPHFGTKTTRVTRYREALEKAQKAKLEQYELVPISEEWDKKVRAAVRNGITDYLGPQDLARVVPQYAGRGQDNWLNDETINKYLELVAVHGRKNDRPEQVRSHHTFNNFFYNNLRAKGPGSVVRWSKRAKIGGKSLAYVEKVFVPINSGAHWTLAVVEPTEKRITHYNSMRGAGIGIQACNDLKEWVALELGNDFKEEEWTLTSVGESPQQTNCDDCGIFTITSARQIMLGLTPMSYGPAQIPVQRIRIVAELINKGLLRSANQA